MDVYFDSFAAFRLQPEDQIRLKGVVPPSYEAFDGRYIPVAYGDRPDAVRVPGHMSAIATGDNGRDVQILFFSINGRDHRPDGVPWFVIWSVDKTSLRAAFSGSNHATPDGAATLCRSVEATLMTSPQQFQRRNLECPVRVQAYCGIVEQNGDDVRMIVPDRPEPPSADYHQMGDRWHWRPQRG